MVFVLPNTRYGSSSKPLLNNTMVLPPKKQSVDKWAAYLIYQARLGKQALLVHLNQKRLNQEGISLFEDSRNHSEESQKGSIMTIMTNYQ